MSREPDDRAARQVCAALLKNGMAAIWAPERAKALEHAVALILPGDRIGVGGSVTLEEIGLMEVLRSARVPQGTFTFYDQYRTDIAREEALSLRHKSLESDLFFSGANAITLGGELVNMDGYGNRIAGLAFGPKRICVIAGINKIVADIPAALARITTIAAPRNCRRLNRLTPCHETGRCNDAACQAPERICNVYSVIRRQPGGNRITVILVNETLGF
jgi:L-lactate utilization protein LutB